MANLIISGLDASTGQLNEASSGDTIVDVDGNLILAGGVELISETTSIDGTSTGTTSLYTVPSGTQIVITEAIVRVTSADTVTGVPTLGIGIAAGEDDIIFPQALTGLSATGDVFTLDVNAKSVVASGGSTISLGIDMAGTATTLTLAVDLVGYVVGATSISPGGSSLLLSQMALSANQGTGTGLVKVNVDTTVVDTAGAADVANNRLTVPAALNGKRVRVYGRVIFSGSPSWSGTDVVGVRVAHEDSGGSSIADYIERDQATSGANAQYMSIATPSFAVSTNDRISLEGFIANFTASREYVGAASAGSRCSIEMEVLD